MMSVQQVTFIKRYQILASLTAVLHATTAPMPFSIIICVSFTVGFFFINLLVERKSNLEQSHSLNYILSSATPKCLHWRYRFSIEVVKTWCKVIRHCRKSLIFMTTWPMETSNFCRKLSFASKNSDESCEWSAFI